MLTEEMLEALVELFEAKAKQVVEDHRDSYCHSEDGNSYDNSQEFCKLKQEFINTFIFGDES